MFDLRVSKFNNGAFVTISCSDTLIDLGLIDLYEASVLLDGLKSAVDDIEWLVNSLTPGESCSNHLTNS